MSDAEIRSRAARSGSRVLLAILAVGALIALAGCSGAPRAVLHVPGNYVAELGIPTIEYPSGAPTATVLLCLDTASAVRLETGEGGQGGVGIIRLDWYGTLHQAPSTGDPTSLTTPVLQPGCGLLTFGPDCCRIDQYLAIKATKV
jgi:hypothetical protein